MANTYNNASSLADEMTKVLLHGEATSSPISITANMSCYPARHRRNRSRREDLRRHVQSNLPMGTLHTGATSAFFECATTWALYPIAKPGFWKSLRICRTIASTYLRPAVQGEVLLMECEVSVLW